MATTDNNTPRVPDLLDRHPLLRVLMWLVTISAALLTLGLIWSVILHFSSIILLFFLAWVISFTLQPLATMLERRHLPRLLAVSLIYLALLAVAAGGILLAIPTIHSEVQFIANELTGTLTSSNLTNLSNGIVQYLHSLGISERDARNLVNQASGRIPEFTATLANNAVQTTAGLLGAAINLMVNTVIVLILSFYMMLDGDRLLEGLIRRLPRAWHPDIATLQRHIDQIFGGFLRAQLILALMFGVVTYVVLVILGQPNGLIFALLAALLMLIPFVGPVLALLPPLSLILLQAPTNTLILKLIIAAAVLGMAESVIMQFVAPQVMKAQVGLHPLLLIAALLIGAEESGLWGALFAGPIAAVLVAVFDTFSDRIRDATGLYRDPEMAMLTRDEATLLATSVGASTDDTPQPGADEPVDAPTFPPTLASEFVEVGASSPNGQQSHEPTGQASSEQPAADKATCAESPTEHAPANQPTLSANTGHNGTSAESGDATHQPANGARQPLADTPVESLEASSSMHQRAGHTDSRHINGVVGGQQSPSSIASRPSVGTAAASNGGTAPHTRPAHAGKHTRRRSQPAPGTRGRRA